MVKPLKVLFKLHHLTTLGSAVVVAFVPSASLAAAAICIASYALLIAQKFVPEKQDLALNKIKELEKILLDQQTEISKLNVMLGVGNTQRNRENLVRGLTGVSGA